MTQFKIVDGVEEPLSDADAALFAELAANREADGWVSVRSERNARLAACDWTQLPDSPLSNVEAQEWASYRQALRDITDQADPFNITWPKEPA